MPGKGFLAVAVTLAGAQPALAELDWHNGSYLCDRDVSLPYVRVNDPDAGIIVLTVEGSQITLVQEPAGSGVRYGWPSDGAHYVWHEKGATATLSWSEAGQESVVYHNCQLQM